MSILDIWKTVVVPKDEMEATIKRVESEGTHRWAAGAEGPHVGDGLIRLTFLPHSAFLKDPPHDQT